MADVLCSGRSCVPDTYNIFGPNILRSQPYQSTKKTSVTAQVFSSLPSALPHCAHRPSPKVVITVVRTSPPARLGAACPDGSQGHVINVEPLMFLSESVPFAPFGILIVLLKEDIPGPKACLAIFLLDVSFFIRIITILAVLFFSKASAHTFGVPWDKFSPNAHAAPLCHSSSGNSKRPCVPVSASPLLPSQSGFTTATSCIDLGFECSLPSTVIGRACQIKPGYSCLLDTKISSGSLSGSSRLPYTRRILGSSHLEMHRFRSRCTSCHDGFAPSSVVRGALLCSTSFSPT